MRTSSRGKSPRGILRRTGRSAVEAMLVLPVVITFLFGILEYGRYVMTMQVLTNAAREGNVSAGDAKILLDRRQRHDETPHTDAADRAQGHAGGETPPGVRRFNSRHDQPPSAPCVLT